MIDVYIRSLDDADKPYALVAWREAHHAAAAKRMPWKFYKERYGRLFEQLLSDHISLGAYSDGGELLGFIVFTPGKRIHTLHWVQTKYQDEHKISLRRRGVASQLIAAAKLGDRFAYTLHGRRVNGATLDEIVAKHLLNKGQVAAYVDLLEWIK